MPVIVLDPGHGGSDPGALGPSGLKESDVVLDVCKRIPSYLHGHNIIFTRTTDKTTSLVERSNTANWKKADIFVSVHCNAHTTTQAHGTETYCYKFGGEGERLATLIQGQMVILAGLHNRGVKEKNLHVLRETGMPAALVELAFISNPKEEALLRRTDFKNQCARAIANGIEEYFGQGGGSVQDVKLTINDRPSSLPAKLIDGRVMVSLRDLASHINNDLLVVELGVFDSKNKSLDIKIRGK